MLFDIILIQVKSIRGLDTDLLSIFDNLIISHKACAKETSQEIKNQFRIFFCKEEMEQI